MERRRWTNRLWIILLVIGLITLGLTAILWFYAFDDGNSVVAAGVVWLTVSAASVATFGVGFLSYSRIHVVTKWRLFARRDSDFRK